jgi:hypothetical protein
MAGNGAAPMSGVEGGEDRVVAQYPVYLTRGPDPGGALYLLQSPLRPAARPYELEECDEVRFKVRLAPRARAQRAFAMPAPWGSSSEALQP